MATRINFNFNNWDQLETFHFSMIMNQFQEKLKKVLLPMVGPTKNEDEKRIFKLINRHAKAFKANDTQVVLKSEDHKEAIPVFASSVQLFYNSQWSLQNTTQIPQENIPLVKSLSVEVETCSYLDSILKKVEVLTEMEEIQLLPKNDFMR